MRRSGGPWRRRLTLCLAACIAGTGWAVSAEEVHLPHALTDRWWDVQAGRFLTESEFQDVLARSRHVLLGEAHDSVPHHARQLQLLRMLSSQGLKPTLAMEQLDTEHQAALAAAQAVQVRDAERLADAGQLNRKAWRWPFYKDLIAWAAEQGWPIRAANLSRAEARRIARGEVTPDLPPVLLSQQRLLEDDIVRGHCGYQPPPATLTAMVVAQRARDHRMAQTLDGAGGQTVLIAGLGHVRADRAAPLYLSDPRGVISVGMLETLPGKTQPADYPLSGLDVVWFTPPQARNNPCQAALPGQTVVPPDVKKVLP